MSLLEELKQIKQLPIFPLPVVLLPGMVLPLHIFEPRYRQMLHDCIHAGRLFGLTYHPQSTVGTLVIPVEGSIGCGARITAVIPLPDGRSNIMTVGLCRYKTLEYLMQDPYLVSRIEFFVDDPESSEIPQDLIQEVVGLFGRFVDALRILRDEPRTAYRLPEDPELSSFAIASVVMSEPEEQLEVLQMRSTQGRFQFLQQHLDALIDRIELLAEDHIAARGNGRQKRSLFH